MRLDHKWDSQFVSVYSEFPFIKSLTNTNEVLLELDWHGTGNVYFKYNAKGASESIKRLKTKCKIK